MNQNLIENIEDVKKWYLGIQTIFEHIQLCNNWSKEEAWDKLRIELINSVGERNLIPDDLEWVKGLLIDGNEINIEEALRVSKRYPDSTPLLDALSRLF